MASRRQVLGGLAATFAFGIGGHMQSASAQEDAVPPLHGSSRGPDGADALTMFDDVQGTRTLDPLPDRGHAVAIAPGRRLAVLCARRWPNGRLK